MLDELERLVHRGEHPEPEQVELDELERLDVALVELDDDPVDHRRPLDRGDVDERRGGHEHPARVDREVAREAVDPGAELEPALPVATARPSTRRAAGAAAPARPGRPSEWAAAAPWSARRGAGGSQRSAGRAGRSRDPSVARGGGSSWPLSGSIRRPSTSGGATSRSAIGLVAGPAARPQPGDAGRRVARAALVVGPAARPDRRRRLGRALPHPDRPSRGTPGSRRRSEPRATAARVARDRVLELGRLAGIAGARSPSPLPEPGERSRCVRVLRLRRLAPGRHLPDERHPRVQLAHPVDEAERLGGLGRARPRPAVPRPAAGRTRRTRRPPRGRAGP